MSTINPITCTKANAAGYRKAGYRICVLPGPDKHADPRELARNIPGPSITKLLRKHARAGEQGVVVVAPFRTPALSSFWIVPMGIERLSPADVHTHMNVLREWARCAGRDIQHLRIAETLSEFEQDTGIAACRRAWAEIRRHASASGRPSPGNHLVAMHPEIVDVVRNAADRNAAVRLVFARIRNTPLRARSRNVAAYVDVIWAAVRGEAGKGLRITAGGTPAAVRMVA